MRANHTNSGPVPLQQTHSPVKRRILLVDDDAAVLLTLKAVLEMHEFQVDSASSSAEALQKLAANVYHMVITDVHMESDTAGLEVIHAARTQPYSPATALLTAFPPPDADWHQGQTLFIKPIGMQDLLRQIEALLVRHEDEKHLLAMAKHGSNRRPAETRERRRPAS
jgi:DNA-binding response OmpR family regulator